ncbi:MAG: hopanoid biosynthesis-associated protein HpnK, partial [Rhodospirillaceae bacterium]
MPVIAAVETAHRDGILTATCLMVSGAAAEDAVARAKRLPGLAVGLHVVTVCGRPTLPPDEVPALVDEAGNFDDDLVRAGFRYFFQPAARRQLAREIRAQFTAFAATGLPLDHVNAHTHKHVLPTVFGMILRIGREFGLKAVRVPWEPPAPDRRPTLGQVFVGWWIALLRRRAVRAGLRVNDRLYGLGASGRMDRDAWLPMLRDLPDGVSEIVCHTATERWDGI